ncbi:MAG: glycine cleavage system protein GcvH [Polyangiaceae bacterium]|jgi:glycine cleavage system H protein|nr:glycine cleavage system protein GcvH [Polyangiaceae bacterium]
MSDAKFPSDRRYTIDHEWALTQGGEVLVGVSAFAVEQLGDITLVSIDVSVGDELEAGKSFGTIESVKTLSDMFAPVSGTLVRINTNLEDKPELINQDCYDKGWIIAVKLSKPSQLEALLDVTAYEKLVQSEH